VCAGEIWFPLPFLRKKNPFRCQYIQKALEFASKVPKPKPKRDVVHTNRNNSNMEDYLSNAGTHTHSHSLTYARTNTDETGERVHFEAELAALEMQHKIDQDVVSRIKKDLRKRT